MVKPQDNRRKKNNIHADSPKDLPEDREAHIRRVMAEQEETDYLSNLRRRIAEQDNSTYVNSPTKAMKQTGSANHKSDMNSDSGKDTVESELLGSLHDFQLEPQVSPKPSDTAKESPPVKPEDTEQIAPSPALPSPPVESHPAPPASPIQPGAIVKLDDGTIGIFEQEIPDKEYDIVLMVKADGTLEPKGVSIYAYQWQQIGSVPGDLLAQMTRRMRWERDALLYHLDRYEYAKLIPNQEAPPQKPGQVSPVTKTSRANSRVGSAGEPGLERGRVISITTGDKTWDAVYWGSNNMGAIVAHNTHKTWSLMHLDLKRFKGSLKYGELIDSETIRKIEEELTKNQHLE